MSVDGTGLDTTSGQVGPHDDSPSALAALFAPRLRADAEPGVWSLLLVPVLVCVAMVIFVAVVPAG